MTKTRAERKKEFLAALGYFNESQTGWATRHGVTQSHLHYILAGKRASGRIETLIDAYVAAFKAKVAGNGKASRHPRKPVIQSPALAA